MTRECKRNSSLNFIVIVIVIVILAVAFTVRAQGTGDGQQLIEPSATAERVDAQQPSLSPLVVGSPGTNEDRPEIMTSSAAASSSNAPIFMQRAIYDSGGKQGWTVAVADLNVDGKPDLVAVNFNEGPPFWTGIEGSVGVLLGKGNGLFLPTVVYASGGGGPAGVAIGDLNGDRKPDLVVANQNCPSFRSSCTGVLLGNGDGTFQPAVIYASGGLSLTRGLGHYNARLPVMISDVNADTKPDIVVVSQAGLDFTGNGRVGVLLGTGNGTFNPVVTYDSGGVNALSGVLADVNGDEKADVVVGNCSGYCYTQTVLVGVLLGNGDGTFQPAKTYGTGRVGGFWLPLLMADLNGDRNLDILVGGGSLGVLLGNGDGTFQPTVTYDASQGVINSLAVTDLNGDGKLDVAAAAGRLGVFLGKGDGTFEPFLAIQPATLWAFQVLASDLSHDGKPDLAGISHNPFALLANGDGTFQEAQDYKWGSVQFSQGILADLNLDGKPDLVTANWCCTPNYAYKGSVSVLLNVFTDATTTTLSSSLNPSTYGQKVTWTAKVATSGSIPPTGRVIFRTSGDGQNYEIGAAALDASGAATLTRSTLNVPLGGSYPMVAVYLGDTMNSRSQSEVVLQNVRQTTSVATITSSRNPSSLGQAVTFTAAISSPTVTVTGPVTFTAGTKVLGTVQLSRGKATFTTSALPIGSTRVQVTYPWNSNVAGSSASLVQTVQ